MCLGRDISPRCSPRLSRPWIPVRGSGTPSLDRNPSTGDRGKHVFVNAAKKARSSARPSRHDTRARVCRFSLGARSFFIPARRASSYFRRRGSSFVFFSRSARIPLSKDTYVAYSRNVVFLQISEVSNSFLEILLILLLQNCHPSSKHDLLSP